MNAEKQLVLKMIHINGELFVLKVRKLPPYQSKLLMIYLLFLEPFDLTNTARSVYDLEVYEKIKTVFRKSYQLLNSTFDVEMLFTTPFFIPIRNIHYFSNPPSPNAYRYGLENVDMNRPVLHEYRPYYPGRPELELTNLATRDFENIGIEQRDLNTRKHGQRNHCSRDKLETTRSQVIGVEPNKGHRPQNARFQSIAKA